MDRTLAFNFNLQNKANKFNCPVGWDCRIQTASLQRSKPPPQVSWYDSKQSDGEVPVMLEFWGMRSTVSLPLLSIWLWPGVVAPDRVLSMGQIELNCIFMPNWIAWNWTVFDIETVVTLN